MAVANAFAPASMADINAHFGKVSRSDLDAHRSLRGDEDLTRILSSRVAQGLPETHAAVRQGDVPA